MRRAATSFCFWLFCSLFAFGATSAFAVNDHRCCADGCKGMVQCVSVSCQTCASVAGPAPGDLPPVVPALQAVAPSPLQPDRDAPLHEPWKPPKA